MHSKTQSSHSIFHVTWESANGVIAITISLLLLLFVILFIVFTAHPVQGQMCRVTHNFAGLPDRAGPMAGLTIGVHQQICTALRRKQAPTTVLLSGR